jgi:hypothetical protein
LQLFLLVLSGHAHDAAGHGLVGHLAQRRLKAQHFAKALSENPSL